MNRISLPAPRKILPLPVVLLACSVFFSASALLPYIRYNAWRAEKQAAADIRLDVYSEQDAVAGLDYCLPHPGLPACSRHFFETQPPGVACFAPKCAWGHVTILSLGNAGLTRLPDRLAGLSGLVHLDLHGNQLTVLAAVIGELRHLKRLDLSDNRLVSLPAEIGELQELEELDLSGNLLIDLPPEFSRLQKLETLKLSNNQMAGIPSVLKQLPGLSYLDVDGNPLRGPLPPFLVETRLKYFMFSRTGACVSVDETFQSWVRGISSIYYGAPYLPVQLCSLTGADQQAMLALHQAAGEAAGWDPQALPCTWPGVGCDAAGHVIYLRLPPNTLSSLPPEIGLLRELQALDVSYSQLKELPPQIGQLTKLSYLALLRNRIESLPPEIGELQSLRTLDLWANRLSALPVELGKLTQLEYLNVGGNPLTGPLPHFLVGMQSVKVEFSGTAYCIPNDPEILSWLERQVTGYYLMEGSQMNYVPVDPRRAVQEYLENNGCSTTP